MERGAGENVGADRLDHWVELGGHLAHPTRHDGAIDGDATTGVDLALPVQGLVIAILRDQDVGQERRAGAAALDRQGRHRRLHDRLASAAAQLGPGMAHDAERGRHVLQHLAFVGADDPEPRATTLGAALGRGVGHRLARQVLGHWPTRAGCTVCRRWRRLGAQRGGAGRSLGLVLLELADGQLQLLDGPLDLLRGTAEPRPLQSGQLRLQLLDVQRLGVELGPVGCGVPTTPRSRTAISRCISTCSDRAKARRSSGSLGKVAVANDMLFV